MMKDKMKLPGEAYLALQALKDQAIAVSANNMEGSKTELYDAQKRMSKYEPWTARIARKILLGKKDFTIETVDKNWLDSQFS